MALVQWRLLDSTVCPLCVLRKGPRYLEVLVVALVH